jgi:hypothetical protein
MAADRGAVVPVLLEAAGLLSDQVPKVLCIICDVALPDIYRTADAADDPPFVACFTVTQHDALQLQLRHDSTAREHACANDTPLDFIDFLASGADAFRVWHNAGCWIVSRQTAS